MSIGRLKDKKNDDSVSLQRALEPHYIHKVDGKDWRRHWRRFETVTS